MMELTDSVAKICGTSMLAVLNERAENVIAVINYVIAKGAEKKTERAKVDDHFWDF